jgi:hypothetical protein
LSIHDSVLRHTFRSIEFHPRFKQLINQPSDSSGDIDVDVPKTWYHSSMGKGALERIVITKHPVKTRVPGMGIPSHVKSSKRQTLTEEKVAPAVSPLPVIRVVEENVVEGVPFSDKFFVTVDWRARWLPPPPPPPPPSSSRSSSSSHCHRSLCRIEAHLHVVFTGRFLLEGVVARNSASETGDTLKTWETMALERFFRAVEDHDDPAAAEQQQAPPPLHKKRELFSCLRKGLKEPRSIGVLITALCTSLVLLLTNKLPAAVFGGGAGAGVPGGIH